MGSSSVNLSSGISVFAAVVDAGTFAAASELMGMSPPGVSRAIARLETRLKIRLFNRTTRAVSLTEEGRRFYEQVMPHLRGMEEAAAAAAGGGVTVRGKLRVNLDPAFFRIALGASGSNVLRLVGSYGLVLATVGIGLGVGGALALTRFMKALLFGVSPADPATLITVCGLLGFITLAACYIPARRATKVEPVEALRHE